MVRRAGDVCSKCHHRIRVEKDEKLQWLECNCRSSGYEDISGDDGHDDFFERAIREIVRDELRATRVVSSCRDAVQGGGGGTNADALEVESCDEVRCPLCMDAEEIELPIQNPQTPSVYFIQSESNLWVKIGYGGFPLVRLSAMQCGSPVPLRLIGVTHSGGQHLETVLHLKFRNARQHGEWFELTRPLFHAIHQVRRRWPIHNIQLAPVLVPVEWFSE